MENRSTPDRDSSCSQMFKSCNTR